MSISAAFPHRETGRGSVDSIPKDRRFSTAKGPSQNGTFVESFICPFAGAMDVFREVGCSLLD